MDTTLSKRISNLIHDIKQQDFLSNPLVSEIVKSNCISENDVANFVSYHHAPNESYGRQLIYDNGNFKILLMSWNVGDYTAIHNHGYTEWGCVCFFGEATHRTYSVINDELKILQKDSFHKGQTASVCGDLTHIMGNSSSEKFITLHIYGSNNRKKEVSKNAIVYLPEFNKEVTTMGSAYLNMNEQLILSEKPLKKVCGEAASDYFALVKPFYERNGLHSVLNRMEKNLKI